MSSLLKKIMSSAAMVVLVAGAAGCVVYPEKQDFGESVRHVQAIQVARPIMATAPQDGERAKAVLEAYRRDISEPQEVQNDIVINVGQ